jgi:hypothetical protein
MKSMLKVSHKTVIENQGPCETGWDDYSWEVAYHDGTHPSFTISYIEASDYKNNQHNNMTVEEAVEIARAILRMAGKNA